METRARDLIEQGDRLFSARAPLLSLWQSIAEQFYVERADFQVRRSIGAEYAAHLMTGAPLMMRRDLANALSTMLRPPDKTWFFPRTTNERVNDDATARQWLDMAGDTQRRAMYDRTSQFVRATKEGDNDFATFGQCVITGEINAAGNGMLYRCWHLRDVAWCENAEGVIDTIHRKWKLPARNLLKLFPKTAPQQVQDIAAREPWQDIHCRHVVVPAGDYDLPMKGRSKTPFVSVYIDEDHGAILEEKGVYEVDYVIPRWATASGSQYAHSPATVIALPDARLLQQITLTLLEAGEKAVDPPYVAVGEAITGGVNLYAGGITQVDAKYDERLGEVLRPLPIDRSGLNWGDERENKIREMISEAFYLNQINFPALTKEMTAYESQQLVQQYIRRAVPLFEPMETEYNGQLCELTFAKMMRAGAFGPKGNMPAILRGEDIHFQFEGPLQNAAGKIKSDAFLQSAQLLNIAAGLDPSVRFDLNIDKAFRDALDGAGALSDWIVPEDQAAKAKAVAAQEAQAQAIAQTMAQGADVAQKVGAAGQALQQGGLM